MLQDLQQNNVSPYKKCGREYANVYNKWCKPCQIDNLKTTNLTSGNEKIDNFIQEMQLKIDEYNDIVFEWIPYNQFSDINKEIVKGGFATVYSAIWKDVKSSHIRRSTEPAEIKDL